MSNREQVMQIIDAMPEYRIAGLLAFLRSFEDVPNQETVEALEEVNGMIGGGSGERFTGSTSDFFHQILEG